jgi:hypothetical protein
MGYLFVVLVVVLLLFGYFFWKKRNSKMKKMVETAGQVASEILAKPQEWSVEEMRSNLLSLNVETRTKKGFSEPMLEIFERLVDKLDTIIFKMHHKWPTSDLTWEMGRIASKHLPDFMTKFFALSSVQLADKEKQFLESLKTIEKEVDETIKLFETNAENEAGTRASIIKRKFEQAPSE